MPIIEGHGNGAKVSGYVVQHVREVGERFDGGFGAVQIPGQTPGTNRQGIYGDMPDHQEGVESLGTTGEDATERGGGYAGVIYVLQGGIPGGTYIWIVAVGCVRINVEDGGGY